METTPPKWAAAFKKINEQFQKAVQSLESIYQENKEAHRAQAEASERDQRSNVSILPTRIIVESLPALPDEEQTYNKRKHSRERIGFHVQCTTLAVLTIYTGIVGYQSCLTRQAIHDSEDSFKETLCQTKAQTAAQRESACAARGSAEAMANQVTKLNRQITDFETSKKRYCVLELRFLLTNLEPPSKSRISGTVPLEA